MYNLRKVYTYLVDIIVTGATVAENDKHLKYLLAAAADCRLTQNEEKLQIRATSFRCLGTKFLSTKSNLIPTDCKCCSTFRRLQIHSKGTFKRASGIFFHYSK